LTEAPQETPAALVKRVVRAIPPGRAATYGTVGRVAAAFDRPIGGARTVAWILATLRGDDGTPWQRVVGAGGKILLPDRRGAVQRSRLKHDGVRFSKALVASACLLGEDELLFLLYRRPRRRA
jgi:alkylated DNA nucleotide flippase Atl1